jgi:PA14 domain
MTQRTQAIIAVAAGLALLAFAIGLIIWAFQPAATISLQTEPLSGRSGAAVTVTGAHFPHNREIYVGLAAPNVPPMAGTSYATAFSDRDGNFSVTFPFPLAPNWTTLPEVVVYAGTPAGETVATARLPLSSFAPLLTPTVTLTPSLTPSPLPVLASATPTPPPSATPLPTATPAPSVTPSPSLPPIPSIIIQPATGRMGDVVQVSGRGWRPNETLVVNLLGFGTQPTLKVGAGGTDAQGNFVTAFVFPVSWSGPSLVTVFVRGPDGSEQALAIFEVLGLVTATPTATPTVPNPTPLIITGWLGQYYNNQSLAGDPTLVRNDDDINFDWGSNSPAPGLIPNEHFSARWTRAIYFSAGSYRFSADSDDGVRVWLDNLSVIDEWHIASGITYSGDVLNLSEGTHTVKVEFFQNVGLSRIHVRWKLIPPSSTPTWTSTPSTKTP